jgi:tRNA A37 N6-isopentenylltransferase MiaA
MKRDRSPWMDVTGKMRSLERNSKRRIRCRRRTIKSQKKMLRDKRRLKELETRDPRQARRLIEVKKFAGKSYEERFRARSKMSEEAELKKED